MTTALFVVSAADRWALSDGTIHPSGFWGEELAIPHKIFTAAGWDVTVATPGGVPPTLDRLSMGRTAGRPARIREVADHLASIRDELDAPRRVDEVDEAAFDVVFYPGGHGPMEDLAYDAVSGALLTRRLRSGRPLALLCHSPAASLAAWNDDGSWPFAGYRMTGLSTVEERLNTFGWKAPWYLEDRLKAHGADYSKARLPLRPHVVVDRSLYTGQNPFSSEKLARRIVADVTATAR